MKNFATGTVEGTGAAININTGFEIAYVRIINVDGNAEMEWNKSLAAGYAYKMNGGTNALITSGGVTARDDDDSSMGFTIGADADVNAAAETIIWMAFGE